MRHKIKLSVLLMVAECTAICFSEMINPKNQGSKFTWDVFPKLAFSFVKTQLLLANHVDLLRDPKKIKYIEEYVNKLSHELTSRIT